MGKLVDIMLPCFNEGLIQTAQLYRTDTDIYYRHNPTGLIQTAYRHSHTGLIQTDITGTALLD